jgi:hypothetical protein
VGQTSDDSRLAALEERMTRLEDVSRKSLVIQDQQITLLLAICGRLNIQIGFNDGRQSFVPPPATSPSTFVPPPLTTLLMDSPALGMSGLSLRTPSAASSAHSSARSGPSGMWQPSFADYILILL